MLRAMARLNRDSDKAKALGNTFSGTNRAKQAARAKEAKEMGLTPMDPLEQHELQRKMNAGYTKISERGVRVPKVGRGDAHLRPRPAMIDYIPRRRGEEDIREEFDNFEIPQAPPGAPFQSSDEKKDELAERNQFAIELPGGGTKGRTAKEVLATAPKPTEEDMRAAAEATARADRPLRDQIADEIAERQEFMSNMQALGGLDRDTQARIHSEIAERMQDLNTLEKLGGE